MREKQNPVEKNGQQLSRQRSAFCAMPSGADGGWQEKITRYVPQKLEATLHTAFTKRLN